MFLKATDHMNRPVIINITGISLIEVASIKGQEDGSVVYLDYKEEPLFLQTDVATLFSYLSLYADEYHALEIVPKVTSPKIAPSVAAPKAVNTTVVPLHSNLEGNNMKKGKGKSNKPC
jgi:hypothetical protein